MQIMVYTPAMQGVGEFDGGKITEQKPVGFPGESSVVKRVGPLFYWAWAKSSEEAMIGMHPHKGFEIATYVVQGNAFHGDTLGTKSTVGAGGAQVMQTGSGVSHQEKLSANAELFQIWFEPELTEAFRREPTYRQYEHEEFPIESQLEGRKVKTVIGANAPIQLVADSKMWDVELNSGVQHKHKIPADYTLTALAIRGSGTCMESGDSKQSVPFDHKDFILASTKEQTEIEFMNTADELLRLILIEVPTSVNYSLYPKR